MPIQKITSGIIESNINITGNLSLDSTGTTGFRAPSANTLTFHTAGTEDMRIDSAGNVGFGTSSPSGVGKVAIKTSSTSTTAGLAVISSASDSFLTIYNSGSVHSIGATYSSTGSYQPIAFLTSDVERMRIDTSGRVTKPFQPAFMARTYLGNGNVGSGYAALRFTDIDINRGSHFNNTTGLFTCPVAGDYFVYFNYNLRATADNWTSAFVLRNFTMIIQAWAMPAVSNEYATTVASCVLNCAAGDTIALAYNTIYSAPNSAANYNHASIYLLG